MLFMYFKTATAQKGAPACMLTKQMRVRAEQVPLLARAANGQMAIRLHSQTEAITMKRLGISISALLLLLIAAPALTIAQQDKPAEHEQEDKTARPAQPAKQAQPAREAQPAQHTPKAQPAQAATRPQPPTTTKRASQTQPTRPSAQPSQPAKSAQRASPSSRTAAATHPQPSQGVPRAQQAHNFGGHGGGHITSARFSASFGSSHHFRMSRPAIYQGYSRFNYGGYYFGFYDPWPADWGYSDNVYVDYIGGQYYLIDLAHPGMRLMVNVVI
jgi:outer membrane biosynthesis protein TonB